VFDFTLTDNFQHQSSFFDTENITRRDQRKNAKISDNYIFSHRKNRFKKRTFSIGENMAFVPLSGEIIKSSRCTDFVRGDN
jgi:hypothetical protein